MLLDTIKGRPKAISKSTGVKVEKNIEGTLKQKSKKKKDKNGSSEAKTQLSKSLQLPNRATVEILDDASPDVTPRLDDKAIKERERQLKSEKTRLLNLQAKEKNFVQMGFDAEKQRVLSKRDTFVPGPDVSASDIEKERARLARLEESARAKQKKYQSDVNSRRKYLYQDKAAIKIQAAFRGHLGKQKFMLTNRLKALRENEEFGDWIQVSDPKTGDSWYFNKVTNVSQWEDPNPSKGKNSNNNEDVWSINKSQSMKQTLPQLSDTAPTILTTSSAKVGKGGGAGAGITAKKLSGKAKSMRVSMSLPSLDAMNLTKSGARIDLLREIAASEEAEAKKEVDQILGLDKMAKEDSLLALDGHFKPQLRATVLDALLETRFDTVSTVLADPRWFEKNDANKGLDKKKFKFDTAAKNQDLSRLPFVSQMGIDVSPKKHGKRLDSTDYQEYQGGNGTDENKITNVGELSIKNVEHPGFGGPTDPNTMCFGCWSAGSHRKCALHEEASAGGGAMKASQTMLLCRNWDMDVMRRRYRSEELQEIFMRKDASLRFDPKHKKFSSVVEQRHVIYKSLGNCLEHYNSRMDLFGKIKRWMYSLRTLFQSGEIDPGQKMLETAKMIRLQKTFMGILRVRRFSDTNRTRLPEAPITGHSWPERTGDIQYLFQHKDMSTSSVVELIHIYPLPVPIKLYEAREYHISVPRSIPMPRPSYKANPNDPDGIAMKIMPANSYIHDESPIAWMERMSSSIARDVSGNAAAQIKGITPVTHVQVLQKTKNPIPNTMKFATIGQKPTPGNVAVGGLPLELLVYQLINTFMPAQYGNFMVMDKSAVSPGVTVEATIAFESLLMGPIVQDFIDRPLEHPLNYRRAPTVTINSSVTADVRHYYGQNRPEQTGEQESHGFRTTAWSPCLLTYEETDPQAFVPGQGVVSLNTPKANLSRNTNADSTYPFCESSTRDNSTLDFYHLLLQGTVSAAKAQIFTALTIQEPGEFLKNYRTDLPMGHLVVSVYRSWAFTQRDTIQEFKSDDGVAYWYHRKTGQTFWERPLYVDEEDSPLIGGTELDMIHPEEPAIIQRGSEGATRRYTQGEFRQQMLVHLETEKDAVNRRKAAQSTVKGARERGLIAEPVGLASTMVVPMSSEDNIASRIDFPPNQNQSLAVHDASQSMMRPMTQGSKHQSAGIADRENSREDERGYTPALLIPGQYNVQDINRQQQMGQMDNLGSQSLVQGGRGLEEPSQMGGGSRGYTTGPTTGFAQSGGSATIPAFPGMNPALMANLSSTIGNMFQQMMSMDKANSPQDMLQLGLGMGMALLSSGAVNEVVDAQISTQDGDEGYHGESASYGGGGSRMLTGQSSRGRTPGTGELINWDQQSQKSATGDEIEGGFFPSIPEGSMASSVSELNSYAHATGAVVGKAATGLGLTSPPRTGQQNVAFKGEPIGVVTKTENFSSTRPIDRFEVDQQYEGTAERTNQPLDALEKARGLKIHETITPTPDVAPPKELTISKPANAEIAVKKKHAVMAYPELSTMLADGAPAVYTHKQPAGQGTTFVNEDEAEKQKIVDGTNLRKTTMPKPVGFFDAIVAKHVAQQAVDYLPQVPNLPQSRTIGRVKPRSSAQDWLMINFDPWSAGKNPLGTEFVTSLMAKAEKFAEGGAAQAQDSLEALREKAVGDAFMKVEDEEGLAQQRAEISKAMTLATDFKKLCSLCRHSKFGDAELLINQPDWSVPIDYQDEQGNALLHVVAQNGNKRLVKLCLRRGALLNIQNLTGQTPLHFAFGYGFSEVGEYLISKGADDSVTNKDGLTCYEGLGARELALL